MVYAFFRILYRIEWGDEYVDRAEPGKRKPADAGLFLIRRNCSLQAHIKLWIDFAVTRSDDFFA